MDELALHVLDVIENSVRANASIIVVTVEEKLEENLLEISVEDNGPGLPVSPEAALDPFYTTKSGKRTGLGLSLFRAAAEQAGGTLTVERSVLGGVVVKAVMLLNSIDRSPLGDLATTLSSVVCTNPHLDLRCRLITNGSVCEVRVSEVAQELDAHDRHGLAVARKMSEKIRKGLSAIRCATG